MMAANKGSESALSNGDNPGTLGVPEVVHLLAGVHGEAVGIDQTFAKLKRAEFKRGNDTILATGLMVTLYVEEAHRPERRAALAACFDDYWNAAGSELRWISQPRGLAEDAIKYRWAQPSKQTIVRPVHASMRSGSSLGCMAQSLPARRAGVPPVRRTRSARSVSASMRA